LRENEGGGLWGSGQSVVLKPDVFRGPKDLDGHIDRAKREITGLG